MTESTLGRGEVLNLTTEIVAAHVAHNAINAADVSGLIQSVFSKLTELASGEEVAPVELTPAVPIKRAVTDDYIICLECGTKQKMLKRDLMTAHELRPEEYRAKWGLRADYPMVAPNYAAKRQELAKKFGLGRKRPEPEPQAPAKGRRTRKKAA